MSINSKDAEIAAIKAELAATTAAASKATNDLVAELYELRAMREEYKALWDAVIGFMNSPGSLASTAVEAYAALVRQAMKSRFWNESAGGV